MMCGKQSAVNYYFTLQAQCGICLLLGETIIIPTTNQEHILRSSSAQLHHSLGEKLVSPSMSLSSPISKETTCGPTDATMR